MIHETYLYIHYRVKKSFFFLILIYYTPFFTHYWVYNA